MALRNLNLVSVVRSIQQSKHDTLDAIVAVAAAKIAECQLKPEDGKARTKMDRHGRSAPGHLKGCVMDAGGINVRAIVDWIESVPATAAGHKPTKEVADAYEALLTIHATAKARVG